MDKRKYENCIRMDAIANYRKTVRPKAIGDDRWRFILALRKLEYHLSKESAGGLRKLIIKYYRFQWYRYSLKCNYTIPENVAGPGLGIPHRGTIVINSTARLGKNCRIHEGVTIGSTNGNTQAAIIGDNVFIGSGAKIIGAITIADDVAIGANAVVVKDILEKGTTWAGNPARKISDNDSHSNLPPDLFGGRMSHEDA